MAGHLPDTRRVRVITALREERVWRIQFKRVWRIQFKSDWRIQFGRALENLVRESLEDLSQESLESTRKESLERKSEGLTVDRRVKHPSVWPCAEGERSNGKNADFGP